MTSFEPAPPLTLENSRMRTVMAADTAEELALMKIVGTSLTDGARLALGLHATFYSEVGDEQAVPLACLPGKRVETFYPTFEPVSIDDEENAIRVQFLVSEWMQSYIEAHTSEDDITQSIAFWREVVGLHSKWQEYQLRGYELCFFTSQSHVRRYIVDNPFSGEPEPQPSSRRLSWLPGWLSWLDRGGRGQNPTSS